MDFNKIYIYTTGKRTERIIFRDIETAMIIEHPLVTDPSISITSLTVDKLFELTKFGSVDSILASPTFKEALDNDWIRAYNEFGTEIDNFLIKSFPNWRDFSDEQVPVWDEDERIFKPGNTSGAGVSIKRTLLKVINPLPANQPIRVDMATSYLTYEGNTPDIKSSSSIFNSSLELQIEINSVKQDKGTEVIRFSSNQLQFYRQLEIGEQIYIES